jgi:hypothetical protein
MIELMSPCSDAAIAYNRAALVSFTVRRFVDLLDDDDDDDDEEEEDNCPRL